MLFVSKYRDRIRLGMTFGAVLLFLAVFLNMKTHILYLSVSDSLARGLYIVIPGNIRTGDYVAYEIPPNVRQYADAHGWEGIPNVFIKKVGATEGMEYHVDGDGRFFAGNRYIGTVLDNDSKGQKMSCRKGMHKVPEGEFLPIGTHGRSFDGRYTGTVPVSAIRSRVLPFITE